MHHIYHTEGLILGSGNTGESGKYYHIFTRDLGMIVASAQGVRKMSSKLRFILQDYAHIKIDLITGKNFWKITSASRVNGVELTQNPAVLKIFVRISLLLRRLLAGEDSNPALFADFKAGLSVLLAAVSDEERRNIEAVIVLRLLHNLGYIGDDKTLAYFIASPLETSLVSEVSKDRLKILSEINKALKETHL